MMMFCYAMGAIMLAVFAWGAYLAANYLAGLSVIQNMFGFDQNTVILFTAVGAVIGLVFCLNWVILGMNCSNIRKLKRRRKKKHMEE